VVSTDWSVGGRIKRNIRNELDTTRASGDKRGRGLASGSNKGRCTLHFRSHESIIRDRAGESGVRSGCAAVMIIPHADAYNSISSVPSAIKTRAATMAVTVSGIRAASTGGDSDRVLDRHRDSCSADADPLPVASRVSYPPPSDKFPLRSFSRSVPNGKWSLTQAPSRFIPLTVQLLEPHPLFPTG